MKNRWIMLMTGLLIALMFSCLLVRIASLERTVTKQQEQISVMREALDRQFGGWTADNLEAVAKVLRDRHP